LRCIVFKEKLLIHSFTQFLFTDDAGQKIRVLTTIGVQLTSSIGHYQVIGTKEVCT